MCTVLRKALGGVLLFKRVMKNNEEIDLSYSGYWYTSCTAKCNMTKNEMKKILILKIKFLFHDFISIGLYSMSQYRFRKITTHTNDSLLGAEDSGTAF